MSGERLNRKICNIDDVAELGVLADHASVVCDRCGAKAHNAADVCDPVQIPYAGMLGD
jgi:hypothetical protein